ncbi:reverse transcriptase domain-containing protein [Tanacetum coccineum]
MPGGRPENKIHDDKRRIDENPHNVSTYEGASIEIMYENCFNMLHPTIRERLTETPTTVSRFSDEQVKDRIGRMLWRPKAAQSHPIHHPWNDEIPNPLRNSNLDAYKGYHQVQMAEEDEENTAFYTNQGTYCHTKMLFGLKNAGAMYQRLVDTAFQSHIGQNLEAYVDDMVVKRRTEREMIADFA